MLPWPLMRDASDPACFSQEDSQTEKILREIYLDLLGMILFHSPGHTLESHFLKAVEGKGRFAGQDTLEHVIGTSHSESIKRPQCGYG